MAYILVINTCPDMNSAKEIADTLVGADLAACVTILPAGLSVYRWLGQIESAEEHVLLIKSHDDLYVQLETMIQSLHPYELPEIIAVPISNGSPDYLNWLRDNLNIQE